jgi:hypothetical protein
LILLLDKDCNCCSVVAFPGAGTVRAVAGAALRRAEVDGVAEAPAAEVNKVNCDEVDG